MAEPAVPAIAFPKFLDKLEPDLLNRYKHHLCDALPRLDFICFGASVPAGDKYLTLIVGIDQPGQVTEHQTVFMSKPGARKQHRRQAIVADVNCKTSGNQLGVARPDSQRLIDACAHVESRRSVG